MYTYTLAQFHTQRYDADVQAVAQTAKAIQKENPEKSWSECIEEAERICEVR